MDALLKAAPVPGIFVAFGVALAVVANGVKMDTLNGQWISAPCITLMYGFFALTAIRLLSGFPKVKTIDGPI